MLIPFLVVFGRRRRHGNLLVFACELRRLKRRNDAAHRRVWFFLVECIE
jgi:hypothetical protein